MINGRRRWERGKVDEWEKAGVGKRRWMGVMGEDRSGGK